MLYRWETAIKVAMMEENPNIAELPAYREDLFTIAQKEEIDQILAKVAKNRKSEIDGLRWQLRKNVKQIFDKMYKDIERLDTYGIHIDVLIHNQLESLKKEKALMQLVSQHYRIGNAKCREVLNQEPGKKKWENFCTFEDEVLLQAVDEYFEQLSHACDMLFGSMERIKIQKMEVELQRLESLKKFIQQKIS